MKYTKNTGIAININIFAHCDRFQPFLDRPQVWTVGLATKHCFASQIDESLEVKVCEGKE